MNYRYYAYYGSPGEFGLCTKKEFFIFLSQLKEEAEGREEHLANEYTGFLTLKEAKKYLKMHINGDIDDCRAALRAVNRFRAK